MGQEPIERTLKNAIASDKISHAYMFTGPRGTGKTTTARLLAKALLCQSGPTPDPDGTCEDCELVASGEHPDVYELDAASRTGVENVREEIIGKVNYAPTRGRYKVYIIDEVHMLSTAAFNALLKTLEEPPSHVVFVLCTTDPQKVPETIQSRCQRFDFRRISSEELISRLGAICELEGVPYEGDALDLIAHRANGGMRDALTSLDQLIAFGEGEVTTAVAERMLGSVDSSDLADIVRAIGEHDAAACFRWTSQYMETGADLVQFVQDLTAHMRDMYVMSLAGADVALELTEAARRELQAELPWYGSDRLARMLTVLGDLATELKTSTNQRLSFEIALTRMVRPESDLTLAALAERIETLERALAGGAPAGAVAASVAVGSGVASGGIEAPAVEPMAQAPVRDERPAQSREPQPALYGEPMATAPQQEPQPVPAFQPTAEEPAQPQPQPQSSGQTFGGGAVDVERLWDGVLAHLKKIGPAYGVVFMNTAPSMADGKLTIAFSPDSDFSFKAAQKEDARKALERALARAGAEGMAYQIVRGDAPVARRTVEPAPAAVQAQPTSNLASSQRDPSIPDLRSSTQDDERGGAMMRDPSAIQSEPLPEPPLDATTQATPAAQPVPEPQATEPAVQATSDLRPSTQDDIGAEPATQATPAAQTASAAPQPADSSTADDPDFSDFLTAAFGESIVIEEIQD